MTISQYTKYIKMFINNKLNNNNHLFKLFHVLNFKNKKIKKKLKKLIIKKILLNRKYKKKLLNQLKKTLK